MGKSRKGPGAPGTSTPTGYAHTSDNDPRLHVTMKQTDLDGNKGGSTHETGPGVKSYGEAAAKFNSDRK